MTLEWQHELAEVAARSCATRRRIKGVLLASAKTTFFAGAALKHVLTLKAEDAAPGFAEIEAVKASYRTIETLGRPVVALLAGSALGGGWEVALAAHARFALDDASDPLRHARGLARAHSRARPASPRRCASSACWRRSRTCSRASCSAPREALDSAGSTGSATRADALRAQAVAWIDAHPDAVQPWDRRDYRMPGGTPASPKIAAMLAVAPAVLAQKTRGLYPAPQAILEAMVEGALVDYDTATRIESRKLARIDGRADREEHDPGVLLRPQRDPVGPGAPERRRALAAGRRSASSAPA